MRLSIRHETLHHFAPPAKSVIQTLRLTPRNHEGQHVVHWRIDVDAECRLKASQDAFGNVVHGFTSAGPHAVVSVTAIGEVDTFDTRGVINGAIDRFPPELYLRSTPLTPASAARTTLAGFSLGNDTEVLERLHTLLRAMFEKDTANAGQEQEGAFQSQEAGEARSAEAAAHAFIACARLLETPARYVAGYRMPETSAPLDAMHGWAEAFVPRLGWVGFDPKNGICPDDRYVRVAIGLDSLGARATRAAHIGGGEPVVNVKLVVSELRSRA
ncbi:MAG: transglutaminase family protein [Hyphomicrobiales bacterium]|nr:transglutaminase family protein [Hyphomicrobiales bacterium]